MTIVLGGALADQTNKIGAFKDELGRIKAQLKRTNLKPGEAQALLSRGHQLENMINDLSIPNSQTIPGQAQSTWGTNQPEGENETEFDENGDPVDTEEEEETDEPGGNESTESQNVKSKEDIAKDIEANIENENKNGFDENTKEGQDAKAKAEAAKVAGGPAVQSAAPKEAPTANPENPDAKIAGGPALDAKKPTGAGAGAGAGASAAAGAANAAGNEGKGATSGGSLIDKIKQFGARTQTGIKDGAKKFGEKTKKTFSKEGMKLLLKIPAVRWAIIGIVAVGLVALIAFAIFGSLLGNGNTGATGATYPQPVDPIKDKDWLGRLLMYSGDSEINTKTSADTIELVRKALKDVQTDATLADSTRGMATTALTDLSTFENAATDAIKKAAATKLIADITALKNIYYACSGLFWKDADGKTKVNSYYTFDNKKDLDSLISTGKLPTPLIDKDGKREDNADFPINPKLCGVLVAMADSATGLDHTKLPGIHLSFRGQHTRMTKSKNPKPSSHFCGNGVDINFVHGSTEDVVLAAEMKRWFWANEETLKKAKLWPDELLGGSPNTDQIKYEKLLPGDVIIDTNDHVHLGFGGC